MYYLIYVSTATHPLSEEELLALMQTSRLNNATLGITGMLLCYGRNMMQLLEGEKDVVHQLYEKIARDPLHKGLIILAEGELAERIFADWSMGFKWLSQGEYQQLPGMNQPANVAMLNQALNPKEAEAIQLLKIFHRYNKDN